MPSKHLTEYNSALINRLKPWCDGVPSEVMFNVICFARVWRNNRLYD